MEGKAFYKMFFSLYIALVLQNIITLGVGLADNIMLGAYKEAALSGVTAVNQIQFIFQQLIMALGDGLVIFCSRYWGKHMVGPMKKVIVASMHFALLIAVALFGIITLFPRQVMGCFTTDASIIAEGVGYMGVIRFTYIFFAAAQILLAAVRSMEIVRIAFYLSILTLFINCGMNYILIFGRFGLPELGAVGAAIGTLAARVAECAVLLFYIVKKEKALNLRFQDYLKTDLAVVKEYMRVSLPILLLASLWGFNVAAQTAILGHMAAAAIAANSVASNLFLLAKSAGAGAASASTVIIGKTIGTGDLALAREYAVRLQKMFVAIGVAAGLFLFVIRVPVLGLYRLSPETTELANAFLIVLSVVCVGMSYQMPTNAGIIKGGGDTAYAVKLDLISIWGIVLPVSFAAAFFLKLSPVAVVCCLNADQIFKCVPVFIKVNYGSWMKKLAADG